MEGYSVRQNKVAKLIQTTLAEIIQKKGFQAYGGAMVTVAQVRVSSDLNYAKVYISIFATSKTKEEVLQLVENDSKTLRYELGKMVKNQLRVVPELSFFIDDTLDHIEKIDELLKK
jgi:ribosome-binding factor A